MSHALNPADHRFAETLAAQLPNAVRPLTQAYLEEPRGRFHGQGGVLVAPSSAEEVAVVLRLAASERVGVVPYGGGTGLVSGQIAPDGPAPVILSLERMTQIRAVKPEANLLIAEAGAILATIHAAAAEVDRLFPLTLASQGSARIGGLLSTNAGGVNVLRYGNARDLCLGIEAVLPDGQIYRGLSGLRKDNTGYDLRHLLIGAEGTLGIITAAALALSPRPKERGVAVFAVPGPAEALSLLALARDIAGESVTAFELIHRTSYDFLAATMPDLRLPFATPPEWSTLVEFGLANGSASEALETLFSEGYAQGLAKDGLIAQSEAQADSFWAVREAIPEGNKRIGSIASHDISLPLERIASFVEEGRAAIAKHGPFRINAFGHLGDGNLHYNVFPPEGHDRGEYDALRNEITRTVHDLVHAYGGSFSAEHGVGRLKADDLERYGDPAKLAAMRAIKAALDPAGILNPGAVLK